tara:strand:+ start:571 stop:870 length:300 start_codon:yes stop_codon:yes gene_type:complete
MQITPEVCQTPLEFEFLADALQVTGWIMHVRFRHLDKVQAYQRVNFDIMDLGPLAHDLLVHLAVWWDIDHDIAKYPGRTTQSSARFKAVKATILDLIFP